MENLRNIIENAWEDRALLEKEEVRNAICDVIEKLDKGDLFKYVSANGAFPRKTFSMGEGVEKRYYLEGRRITK